MPALLEFHGPDSVRYLNGQLTQDVRRVAGGSIALPSCVTDAKGCLQFRVWLTEADEGALWIDGPADRAEELEARLTRYLIADDVEAVDLTGKWSLAHFTGVPPQAPAGVRVRQNVRFGVAGTDWWIPAGIESGFPAEIPLLDGEALEAFRIAHGVPAWGRELSQGMLPPEAGLDATDISYHKGCYIGQEVISRIKHAGRVNKRLVRMIFDAGVPPEGGELVDAAGKSAGGLTSVSPALEQGMRHAMGYVKRGVEEVFLVTPDGTRYPAKLRLSGSNSEPRPEGPGLDLVPEAG